MKNSPNMPRGAGGGGGFWMNYGLIIMGILLTGLTAALLVVGWIVMKGGNAEKKPAVATAKEKPPAQPVQEDDRAASRAAGTLAPGTSVAPEASAPASKGIKAPGAPEGGTPEIFQPDNPGEWQRRAEDTMRKFLAAGTVREKLAFVRHPETVEEPMRVYYDVHHRRDPEPGALRGCEFFRLAGRQFAHLVFSGGGHFPTIEVAMERMDDGSMKIDWESLAGVGAMDWDDFKKERPLKPVLLRAMASLGNYYNFEFEETPKWLCMKLTWLDGSTIYAFTERNGETGRRLARFLSADTGRPALVRVAFPEDAASDNCVRLVEWVAGAWFVP